MARWERLEDEAEAASQRLSRGRAGAQAVLDSGAASDLAEGQAVAVPMTLDGVGE